MSDTDSVPTYDGPKCHICCDLMPNDPPPRDDGKWLDVQSQGQTTLATHAYLDQLYEAAAGHCTNCAIIIEALEALEGKSPHIGDNGYVVIKGQLGTPPFSLQYQFDDDHQYYFIEIFKTNGASENCIGLATPIEPDITPQKAAQFARAKLESCLENHTECRSKSPPQLPTRVIHVGSKTQSPRLVETHSGEITSTEYIALSYCWGLSQTLTTTKATYPDRLKEIRQQDIPRTIREAIEFTQYLGVRYIWIDALCIIQDDDADWEREAARMQNVYEDAVCTLSAVSSRDTVTGCFLPRTPTYELGSAKPAHTYYARRACTFTHNKLFENGGELAKYPAMTRGWTYQERLLSRRILYAAFDELVWECLQSVECECTPPEHKVHTKYGGNALVNYKRQAGIPPHLPGGDQSQHGIREASVTYSTLRMWLQLVQTYSERQFTHYSDRLVALAGIARRFNDFNTGLGVYVAGIWSENIHHQLAWKRLSTGENASKRPEFGPSWSWAGVNLPCRFGYLMQPEDVTTRLKLVGYEVQVHSKENQFGSVRRAMLRLEGACAEGCIELEEGKGGGMKRVFVVFQARRYPVTADVPQWATVESFENPQDMLMEKDEVVCLELYQTKTAIIKLREPEERVLVDPNAPWSGIRSGEVYYDYRYPWLVLKRDVGAGEGVYRRVGLLDFDNLLGLRAERHAPGQMIRNAVVKVINIV